MSSSGAPTPDASAPDAPAPDAPVVLTITESGVVHLRLNRPDRFNAIDMQSAVAFRDAVRSIATDPRVRVVVLEGEGRAFCAGGNVRDMAAADDPGAFVGDLAAVMNDALYEMGRLPVAVISAVHGTVAGGGLGVMLAGDVVVAAASTRFIGAYMSVGLTPDCGLAGSLPATIGLARAMELMITSSGIDAPTALQWGLINEIAPDDAVLDRARDVADRIAAGPFAAAGRTRQLLRASIGRDVRACFDAEEVAIRQAAGSTESRALVAAFAGRRSAGGNA